VSLTVKTVPTDALVLDPRNARKHGRRNLEAIQASLSQFGQRRPLVVMPDMMVIAGNGTLEAARVLGWTEIAVTVVPDEWTADQAKAYALADNRTAELASWDDDMLVATLGELDLEGWDLNALGFDGLPVLTTGDEDDAVPDPPADPISKPGDIWALGEHRVACGSSTDAAMVARLFGGEGIADCVVTDPPYGVDYVNGKAKMNPRFTGSHKAIANDALNSVDLQALIYESLGLAREFTADGGAIYVFHSDAKRAEFERAFAECGWHLHQNLVWVKDRFVLGMLDYHSQHEPILYGWKPAKRHAWYGGRKRTAIIADEQPNFAEMDKAALVAHLEALYSATTIIREDRPQRSDDHPTMKPVALLARLLVNSTKRGDVVYDPFLGSGSTLIACERQGRTCYGIELDAGYCDVTVRRWEQATGGKAVLADG
jgi:DNA modification methylase